MNYRDEIIGAVMDVSAFENSPMGHLVPVRGVDNYLAQPYSHYAFVPNPLATECALQTKTMKLLAEAERALGRLDAASVRVPNPHLLVRPALYREAVSTSALEGTYTMLQDVLESDLLEEAERTKEVNEVRNYVTAAFQGLELIKTMPICVSILKKLQKTLVRGTRGDSYDAGSLRSQQVYIGERHRGIGASRFVPPPAGDILEEGMSSWEKWVNAQDDLPLLVKVALAHYQLETLHPFNDGNGRLGRFVVVLQLIDSGALQYPILNISPWLEERKEEYKDHLLNLSRSGQADPWLQFFFEGIRAQADDATARIGRVVGIHDAMRDRLKQAKVRGVVLEILDDLIEYPIITAQMAADRHGVTYPPANHAIQRLVELGYLTEATGRKYGRIYVCQAILNALEEPIGPVPSRAR